MAFKTLIGVDSLAGLEGDPRLVVVDCRFDLADPGAGLRAYLRAHIPGALYADLDRDLSAPIGPLTGRHPLPAPGSARSKRQSTTTSRGSPSSPASESTPIKVLNAMIRA
jgi:3-mercaptopyruvate sulfurtransferase SseA